MSIVQNIARRPGWLFSLLLVVVIGGCDVLDNALDVQAPSRIPAGSLEDPSDADLLVLGAVGDFECALNAYIVLGALTGDEFTDATQTAARWVYDRREVRSDDGIYAESSCTNLGTYTPLSVARWSAENALVRLQDFTDAEVTNRQALVAKAAMYSAFSHLLLGEGFCSGVLLNESLEAGAEVQSEDLFQRAIERFTQAITAAQAVGNDTILNASLIGRARARLDLGDYAGAADDAREVVEGFELVATASGGSARRQNRIYQQSIISEAVSVGPAFRNLVFGGTADPRVEVIDTGDEATDGTPIFLQTKYRDVGDPVPVATWTEAQLIIAEAEARVGDPQEAVDIINMFHARAGLPAFTSTDQAEIIDHVIQERSRELFLEGQRFYDIRRLSLPLVPAPGTPFDNGGDYGDTRCWPLPDVEILNNPNI
ncbi:MAG TPA: RagB/SusD family nutrient uptake outer membrane protein [Longimicrobiaceae bacterium]|nr:RagB/SusD family nutrient uptake outer membrane protein [Longimicrobiaceae bacterium]